MGAVRVRPMFLVEEVEGFWALYVQAGRGWRLLGRGLRPWRA